MKTIQCDVDRLRLYMFFVMNRANFRQLPRLLVVSSVRTSIKTVWFETSYTRSFR